MLLASCLVVNAQNVYKYQDESGRWVFTDRQPEDRRDFQQSRRPASAAPEPRVAVREEQDDHRATLMAENTCLCPVEVGIAFTDAKNIPFSNGDVVSMVVPPGATVPVVTVEPEDSSLPWSYRFSYGYVIGDPGASHRPDGAYRPPFASAKEYRVTQAYPDTRTHDTPDSRYAIDIAMPENSGVYAARDGIVFSVAYSNFRGGVDREKFGAMANVIKILHDDGTFAVYAHLSWDSIRVRPGERVVQGQYIADSGNTGFSTGPHLHFAVLRNEGLKTTSVPIEFTGGPGETVQPRSGGILRNP